MPRTRNLEQVLRATKDLLKKRRALRPDSAASHLERLVAAVAEQLGKNCESTDSRNFWKKHKEEEVEDNTAGTSRLRKPLTTLLDKDGTRTFSRQNITRRRWDSHIFPTKDGFDYEEIPHQFLPLVNTCVKPRYPHWRNTTIRILSAEVRTAHLVVVFLSANLLQGGGHRLHESLVEHITTKCTSYQRTQHLVGIRSSDMRTMSRLRHPAEYVSKANRLRAGHIMRRTEDNLAPRNLEWIPCEAKRTRERQPS
ncbi:unnamed protein product [Strongylus vulgaris]|uniref:Uncharacterized protein n=1 Tax=Strongylus vulgaris TaxID=40348 RepID=A0A3P7J4P0_STRVU|nr:unnamed protein product [Strongylus vulgaris]